MLKAIRKWFTRSIPSDSKSTELTKLLGGVPSDSGEIVNSQTVWRIPEVTNAIRLISNEAARCDLWPYKQLEDGGKIIDRKCPAYPLLTLKPNDWQSCFDFLSTLIASAAWSGNGYGLIKRDAFADPVSLHNLESEKTSPIFEYTDGILSGVWYAYQSDGQTFIYPSEDVIHIKNFSPINGMEGLSLIDNMKGVLGLSIAQVKYASIVMKHGSHINKVLKIPGWVKQEHKEELHRTMQNLHAGVDNAGRLAVLMGGCELESFPTSNEDLQWLQGREFSLIDVANATGLPVSFLNGKGFVAYNSLQQDDLNLLNHTLDAWLTRLELELTLKLIKNRNHKSCFIEFDRSSLLATDPAYAEMQTKLYHAEAISWEEMRGRLNLSKQRNGQFVRPANIVNADLADEKQNKELESPEPQPVIETPQPIEEEETSEQDTTLERAIKLTESNLERIKNRWIKSGGKLDKHDEIIRSSLPDLDCELVLNELKNYEEELNDVLPEQRAEVLNQWNIKETAKQLWR